MTGGVERDLGRLEALLQELSKDQAEDRAASYVHRQELRRQVAGIEVQLARLEAVTRTVEAHDAQLRTHGEQLATHKIFRERVGAVTAIAAGGLSLAFSGLWYLAYTFWDTVVGALRAVLNVGR